MNLLKRLSSSSPQEFALEISGPSEIKHLVHVDGDLSWNFDESIDSKSIFEKVRVIGKGGFGTVVEFLHKPSGLNLAGKMLSKEMVSRATKESLRQEIELMKRIRTPYTISYYGNVIFEDSQTILMEFCQCGSLRDIMDDNGDKPLNEEQIKCVMHDLLHALKRLQQDFSIIHRDIKAGNILLSKNGRLKISDFGVSRQFDSQNTFSTTSIVGTPYWMAPEVINGYKYSFPADIWSVGATAIELFESIPPYSEFPIMRAMVLIATQGFQGFREGSKPTPEFEDFIRKCMIPDPALRATVDDLLSHPFLKDVETINREEVFKELLTHEVIYHPTEEEEKNEKPKNTFTVDTNNNEEEEEIIEEEEEEEEENDGIKTIDFSKHKLNSDTTHKQESKVSDVGTVYISKSEEPKQKLNVDTVVKTDEIKPSISQTEEAAQDNLQTREVKPTEDNIQNDNISKIAQTNDANKAQTIMISNIPPSEEVKESENINDKEISPDKKVEITIKKAIQNINIPTDPKTLIFLAVSALVLCFSFGGKTGLFSMALLIAILYYARNNQM